MSYSKMGYYRIIASLVGVILLLIICMVSIPPRVEIKEVEVEKEKIVEIEREPINTYNVSSVEREMLARLVYLEACTESIECQMAVVSVVMNRLQSGQWGSTLSKVIYYPYQFSPAGLIPKTTPTETNYMAVDYVLRNGSTLPPYVLYFRANYHFDWDGYKPYAQIDDVCFGYLEVDKNER
jgi:hypothetical protein